MRRERFAPRPSATRRALANPAIPLGKRLLRSLQTGLRWIVPCLLGLCTAAAASAERIGGVEVTNIPIATPVGSSGGLLSGYYEIRVQLTNHSGEERRVHLSGSTFPFDRYGTSLIRNVALAAGQTTSVSLYVPINVEENDNEVSRITVRVEGVRDPIDIPTGMPSVGRSYGKSSPMLSATLLSRNVPQEFIDKTDDAAKGKESGAGGGPGSAGGAILTSGDSSPNHSFLRAESPSGQWSGNWLGYSCFQNILLTEDDLNGLTPATQRALRQYVECGGNVFVYGKKLPEFLTQNSVQRSETHYLVGLGTVRQCRSNPLNGGWAEAHQTVTLSPIFPNTSALSVPLTAPAHDDDSSLVVGTATVPVRALLFLIILFGIAIGPVNILLLTRRKQRIQLWWTVPALSATACLAIIGYATFSEGWTPRGRTACVTLLDEREHRAVTVGYTSFYAPLTPSDGLRFQTDVEMTKLEPTTASHGPYSHHYGPPPPRSIDWTTTQHLRSGWVSARIPAYFRIRKNEERRERIAFEQKPDGSWRAVNALGAEIRRLYYVDAEGRIFEGSDLAAGAEGTLRDTGRKAKPAEWQAELRSVGGNLHQLNTLRNSQASSDFVEKLSPGCYFAVLDESPFLETALQGASHRFTAATVLGITKGAAHGR